MIKKKTEISQVKLLRPNGSVAAGETVVMRR